MGSVFLAEKVSTGEPMAIKFLRQDCLEDPAYLARFEREVSALRSIRHPNVVNVFGWYVPQTIESDERPYIVMEYLDGEGLDKVLARQRVLSPLTAVRIMLQILDGLAAAHQMGVVHRDLGPSNVFLIARARGRFHVKLLDFGLARNLSVPTPQSKGVERSDLTERGTLMGKPAYVAPEMLVGQEQDVRADIFACGVLLFRMLTGAFPYKESDSHLLWIERVRDARSGTEYAPPSSFVPDILPALDWITAHAMRVRPEDRYQSVEKMQEEILEVENSLTAEHPSVADWTSSRPGIPALGEVVSRGGSSKPPTADATPTVGAIAPPASVRRRKAAVALAGAAAGAVAVGLAFLFLFRSGGAGSGAASPPAPQDATVAQPEPVEQASAADVLVPDKDAGAAVKTGGPEAVDAAAVAAADAPAETGVELVLVVVRGAPPGAKVRVGDAELAGDPPSGFVPAAEAADLVVEARGYVTWRESLTLDGDRDVTVRMRRVGASGEPGGTPISTIPSVPEEPPF
jgi:serine/threonine-protein kinase